MEIKRLVIQLKTPEEIQLIRDLKARAASVGVPLRDLLIEVISTSLRECPG